MLAHCVHHEFELSDVPIEVNVENERGECMRTVELRSGAETPPLGPGESLGYLRPLLPEPDWRGSGRWVLQPRSAAPKPELEAALSVCLDLHLAKGVDVPGTPGSFLCARTGRKDAASGLRWYAAFGPDRFLLPCPDHEGPAPSCATIARTDGTAFGVAELSPQPGNQPVEHVAWSAVGAIHCNLGEASLGVPFTVEWSRADEPVQREVIAESSGSTTVRWLEPGEWRVSAHAIGLVPMAKTVSVVAGRLAELDLQLEPAADRHRVEVSIRMESGQAFDDPVQLQLVDVAHPEVTYTLDWSGEIPDIRLITRTLELSRSNKYRLELLLEPGVAISGSPALLGAETSHVEFVGLDARGVFRPILRLVHQDGSPMAFESRYSIRARGSCLYGAGSIQPEGGALQRISESEGVCLAIHSTEREFDPLLVCGEALSVLRGGTEAQPSTVRVASPPTIILLRLVNSDDVGIPSVEAELDTGTKLRSDAWGYVTIRTQEQARTMKAHDYLFDVGDGAPTPILDLALLEVGDLMDCPILPAPKQAK